jgi:hypothetical protein
MDFSVEHDNYLESMSNNVAGKKSQNGVQKTLHYLIQLYGFDYSNPAFRAFKFFWLICNEEEKALITFVYALSNDYLLQESVSVVAKCNTGEKVAVERLMEHVELYHPNRFTNNTLRSVAQNIASSWKQAGFIVGKVKNMRNQPAISYKVVAFAMLLSFLDGDRGEFILNSTCVNALCLSETKLRELAVEASKRDYLHYQYAGSVTSISFDKLLNKIGLDAI